MVANGGDELIGSSYVILATVGQDCIGDLESTTYINRAGYWFHPGPNVGEPTGTYLSLFTADRQGEVVLVRWQISYTIDSDGFHVWRQEPGQERTRLNPEPVSGQASYEFVDESAPAGEVEYWVQEVRRDEYSAWFGPVSVSVPPLIYKLDPSWPNPFNPQTTLRFSIPHPAHVRLAIYDLRGKLIRTLADDLQPAGLYTVPWDGRDRRGAAVASGVYFARLESEEGVQTRKMVLAR